MTMVAASLPVSLCAAGSALAVAGFMVLPGLGDRLIEGVLFQPSPGISLAPAELGIEARERRLETADGVTLHAFELPDPRRTTPPRAILFLHGNAGNASDRLPNAAWLASLGHVVLLLDYRGYGMSEGSPTLDGVLRDGEAGLAYLRSQGFDERRIVVFGRSLGGAVGVQLARGRALGGVILESTFSSLADAGRRAFGPLLGPLASRLAAGRLDSRTAVHELRAPLLQLHGNRDTIVPYDIGRDLFAAAPEPKRFYTIEGAGHNDTVSVGGEAYRRALQAFLEEVVPAD